MLVDISTIVKHLPGPHPTAAIVSPSYALELRQPELSDFETCLFSRPVQVAGSLFSKDSWWWTNCFTRGRNWIPTLVQQLFSYMSIYIQRHTHIYPNNGLSLQLGGNTLFPMIVDFCYPNIPELRTHNQQIQQLETAGTVSLVPLLHFKIRW